MLTLEMIYALLQGLPADHLDHLDRAWYLLAVRIQRGLKEGRAPLDALHAALIHSTQWERDAYLRAFAQQAPVLALPDLTARQKDALIALRYAGTCSLQQLTRILALDRSYTRRLLDTLVEKGYAVKYFRRDGAHYLAITSPLSDDSKRQISELMDSFKEALFEQQEEKENKAADQASGESSESTKSRKSRQSRVSPESTESPKSSQSPLSTVGGEGSGVRLNLSPESNESTPSTESVMSPISGGESNHPPRPP